LPRQIVTEIGSDSIGICELCCEFKHCTHARPSFIILYIPVNIITLAKITHTAAEETSFNRLIILRWGTHGVLGRRNVNYPERCSGSRNEKHVVSLYGLDKFIRALFLKL